jgi:hypothetical protein
MDRCGRAIRASFLHFASGVRRRDHRNVRRHIGFIPVVGAAVALFVGLCCVVAWLALAAGFDASVRRRVSLKTWSILEPMLPRIKQGALIAVFVGALVVVGQLIDNSTPEQLRGFTIGAGWLATVVGGLIALGWLLAESVNWIERRAKAYPRRTHFLRAGSGLRFRDFVRFRLPLLDRAWFSSLGSRGFHRYVSPWGSVSWRLLCRQETGRQGPPARGHNPTATRRT